MRVIEVGLPPTQKISCRGSLLGSWRRTGLKPGAARVAVHRLRKRYRALVRETVAETLGSAEQIDQEMAALFAALRG
jgi:hypothetical protein